ncbi:MAG TPA: DUF4124 domain-containing protein [Burkholderiales bacterium]|nr:DUF4124 domain-containing protein [Burkholderiales bacterium]
MVRFAFLLIAAVAFVAEAQTYKWVDERGVVNYSNTPPPKGAKAQPVEDRISVYATDTTAAQIAAVDRRLAALEAEWLQRQQLMAYAAAAPQPPVYDDYRMGSYYAPYILPAVAHRPPRLVHPPVVRPAPRQRAAVRLDLQR